MCGVRMAVSLVISKTRVKHWLYIWTPEEEEDKEEEEEQADEETEEGEENRTCQWKGKPWRRGGTAQLISE